MLRAVLNSGGTTRHGMAVAGAARAVLIAPPAHALQSIRQGVWTDARAWVA
jgi:hypothetical protein